MIKIYKIHIIRLFQINQEYNYIYSILKINSAYKMIAFCIDKFIFTYIYFDRDRKTVAKYAYEMKVNLEFQGSVLSRLVHGH